MALKANSLRQLEWHTSLHANRVFCQQDDMHAAELSKPALETDLHVVVQLSGRWHTDVTPLILKGA